MIIAGQLLLPTSGSRAELAAGWLCIAAGRIAELARGACPHAVDLGGDDYFITPGFIDAHVHLPQFDGIGCDGLPLLEWLNTRIYPMERRWEDSSYAASMTQRVLRQFLSHGTTSFCAYSTVHHQATVAAMEVTRQRGLRACIGQTLIDRLSPEYLTRPTQQQLDEVRLLLERFPPLGESSRVEFGVTPRFAASCTPELMQEVARMARSTGAIVQTHLAETTAECEWVESLFDGKLYTDVYHSMGLLGKRTLLGHGIHLRDEERQVIRRTGSIIAHCPNANVFLQSGVMPRWLWREEGLRVSLGSDIGAGFEVAMPRVARAMIDAAKYLRFSMAPSLSGRGQGGGKVRTGGPLTPTLSQGEREQWLPPTAAEAWHLITTGNADAAGWPQVGRLVVGAEADLLIIRPDIHWRESPDPLAMLLYAWDSRWIERVLIAGSLAQHE